MKYLLLFGKFSDPSCSLHSFFWLLLLGQIKIDFFFKLIHLCSFSTILQEMHKTFQTVDFVVGFLKFERTKTDKPTCTDARTWAAALP